MSSEISRRKRWIGYAALGFFCIFMAVLTAAAAWFLRAAIIADDTVGARLAMACLAALFLLLPALMTWNLLRRKWKTGSFRLSQEERAELFARNRSTYNQPLSMRSKTWQAVVYLLPAMLWTLIAYRSWHHSLHAVMVISTVLTWITAALSLRGILRRPTATPYRA
jgi:hypothetical protein